jgi:hypothetical protein
MRRIMLLLWISAASSALGQATDSTALPQRLCFAPRNLPRCEKYLIFELTGARPMATSRVRQTVAGSTFSSADFKDNYRFSLGVAKNLDGHSSLGVARGWDIGQSGRSFELRYRRWSAGSNAGMEWMAGFESRNVPSTNRRSGRPSCWDHGSS